MPLSATFAAHLSEPARLELAADALEPLLRALVTRGRTAWPDLPLDDDAFVRHIAERIPPDTGVERALEQLAAEDLWLALACAARQPAAVQAFEADLGDSIRAVVTRAAPAAADEIVQKVMEQLLVGEAPAIARYSGRGSLRAWLRVVATRAVYTHARREKRHRGESIDDLIEQLDYDGQDPELLELKRRYRNEFKRAFEHAFLQLGPRERNLLRHDLLDGLSTEQIAALYGVHRATLARWRSGARETLLVETKRYFQEQVKVPADELDSVLRLIRSQMEASVLRLLAESDDR